MAPLALQVRSIGFQKPCQASSQRLQGSMVSGRFTQRVSRHVMRAARLDDVESSVSSGKKERKCKKEEEEEDEFEGDHGLNPQQVEAFLNILCEETDIAQVELKMGGFKMKVRRSLSASTAAASVAPAAPMVTQAPPSPIPAAAPVSPTSSSDVESDVDEDDGSTISITAPKVGIMRRGRYIKGKKVGKAPAVEVGDTVKKGQALCFIEQLGTFWPVEAPQAGEIDSFVVEEGEPVEYGEDLLEIVPFFGGHIIGDSKHA